MAVKTEFLLGAYPLR